MNIEKKVLGWKYYNHAAIPTTTPHEEPDLSPIKNGSIWCIGENGKPNGTLAETLASNRKRRGSISNHRYAFLVMWYYKLYRVAEGLNPICSLRITMCNLFFSVWKKFQYVKSFQQILTVRKAEKD